jgi:histidyl-tRNA synthetase
VASSCAPSTSWTASGPPASARSSAKGRKDESGDFTKGANLSDQQVDVVIGFTEARGADASATLANLDALCGRTSTGAQGLAELRQMGELLAAGGYEGRFALDPATVRGLGYYTGPVFEAELTFEILGDDGKPRQFGSVAGGGRYDDLVKRFTGRGGPRDRRLHRRRPPPRGARARSSAPAEAPGPVIVTVMDRDRMADTFAIVAELRNASIRAEPYLGNPKQFGAQMKYADRRRAPFAIIEGSDEKARGVVQVKDLVAGARAGRDGKPRGVEGPPGAVRGPPRPPRRPSQGPAVQVTPFQHKAAARAEAQRLLAHLREHGAEEVEAAILQPAEELLDLYGEDIRARAFVTQDPLRGEMMLRPDFTVPVVRMHMEAGLDPARYCYLGEVFRRQEAEDPARPSEYLQVGFELFGGRDPAEADAEVFAACSRPGRPPCSPRDGRLGLLLAAVDGLSTTPRQGALRRHVWRPAASARCSTATPAGPPDPAPRALREPRPLRDAGPEIGSRTRAEIEARLAAPARGAGPAVPPRRSLIGPLRSAARGPRRAEPCGLERDAPGLGPRFTGSSGGSRRWNGVAWRSETWLSRAASAAPRSNTTTASSSGSSPPSGPTCRPSPRGAATTL